MSFDVLTTFGPVLDALTGLDLTDPTAARAALESRLSPATMAEVTHALREAHAHTPLTPKRATPTLSFGRLAKATPDTRGFSIDVVDMEGSGAAHTHPMGEVSWCIPLGGAPTFEGATSGWVVMEPGSRHVPSAIGGRMLIVYFLPDGAMDWSA